MIGKLLKVKGSGGTSQTIIWKTLSECPGMNPDSFHFQDAYSDILQAGDFVLVLEKHSFVVRVVSRIGVGWTHGFQFVNV